MEYYSLLKSRKGEDHVFAEVNKEDILSNEAEVKGSNAQLHITVTSTEEEVISAMHSMTHQKVKACEGKEQPLCPKECRESKKYSKRKQFQEQRRAISNY